MAPQVLLAARLAATPPEFALAAVEGPLPQWQARLRERLWVLLGGRPPQEPPDLRVGPPEMRDGYALRRVTFRAAAEGGRGAAWLLTPDAGRRRPGGVLALHGHGPGKDGPAGEGSGGGGPAGDGAFGAAMARRGYIVLIPDAFGFGERADPSGRACGIVGLTSLLSGVPVAAQRLRDDAAALSLLRALSGSPRLGVVGHSEGGRRALLLAALDERVSAAVVSGYFTRVRDEISAWDRLAGWDICNALPGLVAVADLPEIAALCVPRALCIDYGRADPLYTPEAVEAGASQVADLYAREGCADRFLAHGTDGPHRFGGAAVLDWLDARLPG